MSNLDDRLNRSLGGAYTSTFGDAPAILPAAAHGHGVAIIAGVGAAIVVAAVAVPLTIAHTHSGTTAPAANRPAVLETGAPTPVGDLACGPDNVKLTAYLNAASFPESVIEQKDPKLSMTAFVGYGIVTGTGATCRLYSESGSVGFVAPSGEYLAFNGPCRGQRTTEQVNRTGPAPTADPFASAPCTSSTELPTPSPGSLEATPAPAGFAPGAPASESPLPALSAPADPNKDYGILIGTAGTVEVPADGLGAYTYGNQLQELHQGTGPSPEPIYRAITDDYVNDPYLIPKDKVEVGTWKMRITFGSQAVDVPFQVTAG